jgi:hypothetical protein
MLFLVVLMSTASLVLGGRAYEDKIVEDHAYYTMSLYQVCFAICLLDSLGKVRLG